MNYFVAIALVLTMACGGDASVAQESGRGLRGTHELKIQGGVRNYILYRPSLPDGEKVPLMIVLHGGLGNAESVEATTQMNGVADEGKFIVAYPEGTGVRPLIARNRRTWNAGTCCGPAVKQRIDDVGYIAAVIADVAASQPVDLRRVYVTGMSNGAMMAYRLACEIPEKLAAIVPVSGTLMVNNCTMDRNIAVMHIHGDADTNVPFAGGVGESGVTHVPFRPVPETLRLITASRRCSGSETAAVNASVQRTTYHCADGAPVQLLVIHGGGHSWPGGQERRGQSGHSNAISASQMAWEFARQFTKKQ